MSRAKRAFDAVGAAAGLALLAPLLATIAVAIRLHDGGPALFRQVRVGRDARPFGMWKFRTMVPDAERLGGALTVDGDPRITPLGRFLRASKLDELPQLINVLKGEMSLVGPRPEVPRYVARYTAAQRRVLRLTPGMTDPASLRFRDESAVLARAPDPERAYLRDVMPEKLRMNLDYASRATVWSDLGVIARTLARLPRRTGEPREDAPGGHRLPPRPEGEGG